MKIEHKIMKLVSEKRAHFNKIRAQNNENRAQNNEISAKKSTFS